jgi:Ran GTPase-activating protein (RanGAP) involved in mRNA processing and transport
MSDTDSDADSISDGSNAYSDDDDNDDGAHITVRELCDRLRANDPRVLNHDSVFELINSIRHSLPKAEFIAIFQALKENTSVKHIDFSMMLFEQDNNAARSILVATEYLESSKTLQVLNLGYGRYQYPREVGETISLLLRALSRNTSVTKLIIMNIGGVRFASVAFQQLLTCTQTLQKLEIIGFGHEAFDERLTAAVTSGFANNTTLRDLEFNSWREAELVPVLAALQRHPTLQKIHFSGKSMDLPSLSGLEVLLRSQDSKVKELILEQVDIHTVGLHPVLQELARNTTVTNLAIRNSVLSREDVQQLTAALRQNTALQYLDLTSSHLGSAGLAEIAPALYRNTSIKTLDLTTNGLDDIESANILRELLRRNKTITSIYLSDNTFGLNAAATRSILEGVRSNTALQQLGLLRCGLDDQNVSTLANALAIRKAALLELDLRVNDITSVGVRALVDNVEAVNTLIKLCLASNPIGSEGATILADALGRNVMPSLKRLNLCACRIEDDGCVALVSALEQNTSLQILDFEDNAFGARGFMALAESLPNIKRLQEIGLTSNASFQSTMPLLMEGFRKNTSLVVVEVHHSYGERSRELQFLGKRNRFTPLLKASDPLDTSPQLGIWSRALAKVSTEPDVLFHVLCNKPKLVGSTGGSKKRKHDDK